MMYLCVSKHYHYRQRDDVVNEQFLAEEIYDRGFNLAEQLEKAVDECRWFGEILQPQTLCIVIN